MIDEMDLEELRWDEISESGRFCECGKRLEKHYIEDDGYGSTVRIPVWECPDCDY